MVDKTVPDLLVHHIRGKEVWASSRYTIYRGEGGLSNLSPVAETPCPLTGRLMTRCRLLRRGLRLGIRGLKILRSGTVLAIANKGMFRLRGGEIAPVHSFSHGFGPLREGWCEDEKGNVYLSEYFLNLRRNLPVTVSKSADDGQTWAPVSSFPGVRHIHCVQYDAYSKSVWLGTGDRDSESAIFFTEDEGQTWSKIGSGDQMFRAVSLLFTEDHVYWGTDAPTLQNYLYRYDRKTGKVERLAAVPGPVHYSVAFQNGTMLFAISAEGKSEGSSAAWDNKAHIYGSRDGVHWEDLASWEKDDWPYVLGFGRVFFPHGQSQDSLYFSAEALKGIDGASLQARLVE
ncbi:MAG: hypothetical protein HY673_20175 [Chloroflexi bacterium]|nr:hypothetical protein [Chloroflexota bacterium]